MSLFFIFIGLNYQIDKLPLSQNMPDCQTKKISYQMHYTCYTLNRQNFKAFFQSYDVTKNRIKNRGIDYPRRCWWSKSQITHTTNNGRDSSKQCFCLPSINESGSKQAIAVRFKFGTVSLNPTKKNHCLFLAWLPQLTPIPPQRAIPTRQSIL